MILAVHDPAEHVLPHRLFALPFDLNLGEKVPLLNFPLAQEFYFTNHLLMTLVAAGLCLLIFPRLARSYVRAGEVPPAPRGLFANLFEVVLQFVRNEVARPVLKHRTDRFMPFLWTLFFFILFCNLLGLVPLAEIIQLATSGRVTHLGGTATANLAVTGGLAICAFLMIHVSGVREVYQALTSGTYGHAHHGEDASAEAEHPPAHAGKVLSATSAALLAFPLYVWNFAPHVFARQGPRPGPHPVVRTLMIPLFAGLIALEHSGIFGLLGSSAAAAKIGLVIGFIFGVMAGICAGGLHWTDLADGLMWGFLLLLELIGAVIKPFALMIRLFANMVAGHIVLASILALIFAAKTITMGYAVGSISALGCLAISCLELLVAFLQAYIFVFLTTLFISMAVAPEH